MADLEILWSKTGQTTIQARQNSSCSRQSPSNPNLHNVSKFGGGAAALESGLQLAKHYLHASCLHLSTCRVLAGTQPKQYTLLHIQVTLLAAWICLQPTLQAGPQALPGSREKIVAPGASISHEITRHQAKKNLRFLSKKLQNATSCAPKRSRIKPRIACHKKRVEVRFCNSSFSEFGVVLPEKQQSWCG